MRHTILTVLVALTLVLAGVGDALAKAGRTSGSSGGSLGSRGSRTVDRPMERTLTPPPPQSGVRNTTPPTPQAAPRPGAVDAQPLAPGGAQALRPGGALAGGAMAQSPSFFQRNPFMAGMAGGLVGAGIGSMLFGHSPAMAAASDAAPGASFLGLLLQLAIVGGLIWLLVRMFRRRQPAEANPYARDSSPMQVEPMVVAGPPRIARIEKEFEPQMGDQEAFTEILIGVQRAWSEGDLVGLKRFATPEVVSWLSEDLSRNASQGHINKVENVALLKGDVSESWSENGFDYVTAVLTFQCVDYTTRADNGAMVEGNLTVPVQHTEAWTFVRGANGGRWLLSAIEQV
ncbi:conserved membrane hypothetical protein [Candidatus Terasakiella magnetica]|nr:conserved membrane hypothetical protein [Candidatus Terasakiella magnetica]